MITHYRQFLTTLVVLLMGLFAHGAPVAAQGLEPMRFGLLPAESAIPIIVAGEKGLFAAEGLKVELTMFQSPIDRNVAIQAGKIDGAIADVMTVISFREAGLKVTATSDINEDFKLLASPKSGISGISQLDGKDISVVPNFALEYIMDRFARKAGISYRLVNIPSIPARFEALLADRLTAVVFTEPQATLLAARGAKILGGSKTEGFKAGVLMFGDRFLSDSPERVKAFYRAYDKAVSYINSTPAAGYGDLLVRYGFPEAIVGYLNSGVRYSPAAAIEAATFDDIAQWSFAKKISKRVWQLSEIASDRFLP